MMKNTIYPLLTIAILLMSFTIIRTPIKYTVGENFVVEFKSKDPSGSFKNLEGNVLFDPTDLTNSKLNFTLKIASINTGNGMQNKKAQTEEWFHATKYPLIKFESNKITEKDGVFYVYGALFMKGVTKEYRIPMKTENSSNGLVLSGNFSVKRSDFKIGKPSQAVPDIMKITYSIPLEKQ